MESIQTSEFDQTLKLVKLGPDDGDAYAIACENFDEGFNFEFAGYQPNMPWEHNLQTLADFEKGENIPDGYVPSTHLVAKVDNEIVGACSIRHQLNKRLRNWGGHIGYGIMPEHRRKGYATRVCGLALEFCRFELGLQQVLITCDETNTASRKVIETNGGIYESTYTGQDSPGPKQRFWIDLQN